MAKLKDFYAGDSYSFLLRFKDSDGGAMSVADHAIFFTLKAKKEDTDDAAVFCGKFINDTDPDSGTILVSLTPEQTRIAPGGYYYDIQHVSDAGDVKTLIQDKLKILQDITIKTA